MCLSGWVGSIPRNRTSAIGRGENNIIQATLSSLRMRSLAVWPGSSPDPPVTSCGVGIESSVVEIAIYSVLIERGSFDNDTSKLSTALLGKIVVIINYYIIHNTANTLHYIIYLKMIPALIKMRQMILC